MNQPDHELDQEISEIEHIQKKVRTQLEGIGIVPSQPYIAVPGASEHLGGRALLGTPYYQLSGKNSLNPLTHAHESAHLWLAEKADKNNPNQTKNDLDVDAIQLSEIESLANGDYNEIAKKILTFLGINFNVVTPETIKHALEDLNFNSYAHRFTELQDPTKSKNLAKLIVSNFLNTLLEIQSKERLGISSDLEEGLVTYLSNVSQSENPNDWNFHQDTDKTAYAFAFQKLFPDPKILTAMITQIGFIDFMATYRNQIIATKQEILPRVSQLINKQNVEQETKKPTKESQQLTDALLTLSSYEMIAEHGLPPIDNTKVTEDSRADFNRFANKIYEIRNSLFTRDQKMHAYLDEVYYMADNLSYRSYNNFDSIVSSPLFESDSVEQSLSYLSLQLGIDNTTFSEKKIEEKLAMLDVLFDSKSTVVVSIEGQLVLDRKSFSKLQEGESVYTLTKVQSKSQDSEELSKAKQVFQVVKLTKTETSFNTQFHTVFVPNYKDDPENIKAQQSALPPQPNDRDKLMEAFFAKIYRQANQFVLNIFDRIMVNDDLEKQAELAKTLSTKDRAILIVLLFNDGKDISEIRKALNIAESNMDFLRDAFSALDEKIDPDQTKNWYNEQRDEDEFRRRQWWNFYYGPKPDDDSSKIPVIDYSMANEAAEQDFLEYLLANPDKLYAYIQGKSYSFVEKLQQKIAELKKRRADRNYSYDQNQERIRRQHQNNQAIRLRERAY